MFNVYLGSVWLQSWKMGGKKMFYRELIFLENVLLGIVINCVWLVKFSMENVESFVSIWLHFLWNLSIKVIIFSTIGSKICSNCKKKFEKKKLKKKKIYHTEYHSFDFVLHGSCQ
jgi:hypothetical protein